ncbi:hypothetical protein HGG75_14055 [Ochrobactrum pseudogrignonense]|nr:hypothetical protein [Brucella pseudogrignonensis]
MKNMKTGSRKTMEEAILADLAAEVEAATVSETKSRKVRLIAISRLQQSHLLLAVRCFPSLPICNVSI